MLKVVVFDSGFGGELFADHLEEELPVINVIRVIDWRNSDKLLHSRNTARKVAEAALRPYLNKVDLIIFANHLLSLTSLKYFKRKYKKQKFIGFNLKEPDTFIKRETMILATKAITKTINYHNFLFRLRRKTKTYALDEWVTKIDDGELTFSEIEHTLKIYYEKNNTSPKEIILACAQFNDIKDELKEVFGKSVRIYDSFADAVRKTCKALSIRGGNGKKINKNS